MSTTSLASTIEAVTVYRRGALVRRGAELPAPNEGATGAWEVKLEGLPLCLDDGSVRARVEALSDSGDGATSELPEARDLRVSLDVVAPDGGLPAADDDALELVRKQERQLGQRLQVIEEQTDQLERLTLEPRPASRKGERPPPSPTAARLALVALRERRERDLWDERHALKRELQQVRRRRTELDDRDRRGSTARQPRKDELRKAVLVRLEGGGTAPARLAIEYLVPGARWAPAYSVRLGTDTKEVQLAMRALVAQRSGEDWEGVALTLSTAEPQAWTELPKLTSLRIGKQQPPAARAGWRPVPAGIDELFADYDRGVRATPSGPPPPAAPAAPAPAGWGQGELAAERQLREEVAAFDEEVDDDTGVLCALADDLGAAEAAFDGPADFAAPEAKKMKGRARKALARPAAPPPGPPGPAPAAAPLGGTVEGAFAAQAVATSSVMAVSHGGPEAEPPPISVGDQLLDFGRLRLAPPRAAHRGKLTLVTQEDLYLELLVRQQRTIQLDVSAALGWAAAQARRIDERGLSSRHQLAWSESHDYAYPGEAPADVPSDGEYHSLPICQGQSEASLSYVVVPRESCDVFRMAELPNPFDGPLLPGPIDVYRDGDFLIASDLSFTPSQATIELGMGVEQAVKVSRNTRFEERSVGLIGGSTALEHKIQIEALNHLDHAIDLEVRERIPVIPEDQEDIKIEVGEVSPGWEEFEPYPGRAAAESLQGGRRWTIVLAPGEKKTLWAEYDVRIPSKYELVGGNRREG